MIFSTFPISALLLTIEYVLASESAQAFDDSSVQSDEGSVKISLPTEIETFDPYFKIGAQEYESEHNDVDDSIGKIVTDLKGTLTEIGLNRLIDSAYLSKLSEEGYEKELAQKVNVTRVLFKGKYASKLSMAYKPMPRRKEAPASKRGAGEDVMFFKEANDGYVSLGLVSGNSNWLPASRDSLGVCSKMVGKTEKLFMEPESRAFLTADRLLNVSWEAVQKEDVSPGCLSALYTVISPERKISVSNLGRSWAGLFREGILVKSTRRVTHEDGTPFQLCIPDKYFAPSHQDTVYKTSRVYQWNAHARDILVVVSSGVREVLEPKHIYQAFTRLQNWELNEHKFTEDEEFGLVAMGIVKVAHIGSGDPQGSDLSAMAYVIS